MKHAWTHRYAWGNNPVRAAIKGQRCRILARGSMGTVLIATEGGVRVTTSIRALRRLTRRQPVKTTTLRRHEGGAEAIIAGVSAPPPAPAEAQP